YQTNHLLMAVVMTDGLPGTKSPLSLFTVLLAGDGVVLSPTVPDCVGDESWGDKILTPIAPFIPHPETPEGNPVRPVKPPIIKLLKPNGDEVGVPSKFPD